MEGSTSKNSKIIKFIGMIVAFYLLITVFGWIGTRSFDMTKLDGSWSGSRSTKVGGYGHTQYHSLEIANSTFDHSVQNPRSGQFETVRVGQLEKDSMSFIVKEFQQNTDYEIVGIEYNDDDTIYSFCVVRKGGKEDDCDIRFTRRNY